MIPPILTTDVRGEQDVVLARQRARQIASLLGLDALDQTRLATAVSEIARNAVMYGNGGRVMFGLLDDPAMLLVRVSDRGPGIARLQDVLDGRYRSSTGMGLGIVGARRLVERFEIESASGQGTIVVLGKQLPPGAPVSAGMVARVSRELAITLPADPLSEVRAQNQELLRALQEGRERQTEVERLNQELAETNRGVLALYAELDEKAADLARASELKSRFLSNISHELRTPLNAILNITGLLIDRIDGPLTAEQERQVRFVRGAATTLSEMVNDLLDLARIEAGRSIVRPSVFTLADLFAGLRGMFRPIMSSDRVGLVIEDPAEVMELATDEGKLSQILRNLISNALKFTESGEVRVSAAADAGGMIRFTVADTGIGIAPEDLVRLARPFEQVEGQHSKTTQGTGLGLALTKSLIEMHGGQLTMESEPGVGTTVSFDLPVKRPDQTVQPIRAAFAA